MSEREDTESGAKLRAVSNTGPLISAFQCRRADLLEEFYEVIYIAGGEIPEFEKHGASGELKALVDKGFIIVVELTQEEERQATAIAQRIADSSLTRDKDALAHFPEAQAMVLMQREELEATVFLVEERAAFVIAQELQLNPTGFVGTLVKAAHAGLLTPEAVRTLLVTCRQVGTHYSDTLIDEATRLSRR